MAESKGGKRYNHGPKIADKGSKSQGTEHKDVVPERDGVAAPKGSVTSGTDGIGSEKRVPQEPSKDEGTGAEHEVTPKEMPTHERHLAERKEMHGRHAKEQEEMHARHHEEHKKMSSRHEADLKGAY